MTNTTKSNTAQIRPCPICKTPVNWQESSAKPFCSPRCKVIDLGAWASDERSIPMTIQEDEF